MPFTESRRRLESLRDFRRDCQETVFLGEWRHEFREFLMRIKPLLPPLLVVLGVTALVTLAARTPISTRPVEIVAVPPGELAESVRVVDESLAQHWAENKLTPAAEADELTVLRRLSLALHGTVPSLEEIRRFEADRAPHKVERWTSSMLDDTRFADYFAERLARACVGVEGGQFVVFRRDRFTDWLSEQLHENRPWDDIVCDMVSGRGVWTGEGEVNFVTAGFANDEFDENKLAGRTVRAFLGQRIDCAQCHDHPFDHWTQGQFEGLAAQFGQVRLTLGGVQDKAAYLFDLPASLRTTLDAGDVSGDLRKAFREHEHALNWRVAIAPCNAGQCWLIRDVTSPETSNSMEAAVEPGQPRYVVRWQDDRLQVSDATAEYLVEDRKSLDQRVVNPGVPFHPEWLGTEGTRRDRLAEWVTHPENRRFERAIVNRIWGLMFGRPYTVDRPVDDLPDPDDPYTQEKYALLDLLGADFRQHDCDLRRLIQVIASTRAFRLSSVPDDPQDENSELLESTWAVFPVTRLRPEQVIGSMLQASSVKTIDQNSHLFTRARRFFRERNFIDEFGDLGDDELTDRSGTIPQALLRMNGEFSQEMSEANPFSAPGRISGFSSTPDKLLDNAFLVCLTRRPTPAERAHFLPQFEGANGQEDGAVQDLFWTLYNSPEFSWNH